MKKKKKKKEDEEGDEGALCGCTPLPTPPRRTRPRKTPAKAAGREEVTVGGDRWRPGASAALRPCECVWSTAGRVWTVDLPDRNVVKCLAYRPAGAAGRSGAAVRAGLGQPDRHPAAGRVGSRPQATPASSSATSRGRCPTRSCCRRFSKRWKPAGIPRDRILILVATGLHRPKRRRRTGRDGRPARSPPTTASRTTTARQRDEHTYLGDSPRGVPVWIDSPLRRGRSEDHHRADRAAFHGRLLRRPQADLPGHRRPRDDPRLARPASSSNIPTPGTAASTATRSTRRTRGSPGVAGCDFIVNAVIDAQRRILRVVAGDMEAAFLEGRRVRPRPGRRTRCPSRSTSS